MKIVVAPDSFKESLDAAGAAHAIAAGMQRVLPHARYDLVPMADGGEGTVAAMVAATGGELVEREVTGPLGDEVAAHYGILGDGRTAVIEIAAASGLALVPPERRNPMRTTSFGTGELIRDALSRPLDKIIVGLGGSATNEGGIGLCQALGVRFIDQQGDVIAAPIDGERLTAVTDFDLADLDPLISGVRFEAACDVDNPVSGPRGASATFGPQKGATPAQVARLDHSLERLFRLLERRTGQSLVQTPGAGAAGAAGGALLGFLQAELRPGIDIVIDAVDLRARLDEADLVVTAEGRIDAQTMHGKTPHGIARLAAARGIPVVAIGGSLAPDADAVLVDAIDAVEAAVCRPMSTTDALRDARSLLVDAGARVAHWLVLGRRLNG